MLAFQRDFRSLFAVLKEIHTTKQLWREKANGLLAKQAHEAQNSNATAKNPLGESFTEYRQSSINPGKKGGKYNNK